MTQINSIEKALILLEKASTKGFQWKTSTDAFEKLVEEIDEFKNALNDKDKLEEFGDIVFALINYARMKGINADEALNLAIQKFETRFKGMENDAQAQNIIFEDLDLGQKIDLWKKQKDKV